MRRFAGGVAVIPAAQEIIRSNDSEFPFRQNSDFFYLTGFDEPDAVLVLAPDHREHNVYLFLRERDREMEIWNGRRLGVERAAAALGVDIAFSIGALADVLPDLLTNVETLYFALGANPRADGIVRGALERARGLTRRKGFIPDAIVDPSSVLHGLRQVKEATEIATLRRAAAITARGHIAAMKATRPGLFEYEVQAALEYEFRRGGAQSVAYESIVAAGDNATILHYRNSRDRMNDGDLLLIDAACELDYYATDVTRTWPVNGRFSAEQRAIYDIVLRAQEAAIAAVQPGAAQRDFHHAAVRTIAEGLVDVGLLSGSVDEIVETERYRDFYMHGTGHWLGIDVHDVGRYRDPSDEPIRLEPGMVTTIEPGIYVHRDRDCNERFKGIGIRIEDDILVTADGNENLTAAVPKSMNEIEEIVGSCALV